MYQWLTKIPWFDYYIDEHWCFYNSKLVKLWWNEFDWKRWWYIILRKDNQTFRFTKARLIYCTYNWLDYNDQTFKVIMAQPNIYSVNNLISIWKKC